MRLYFLLELLPSCFLLAKRATTITSIQMFPNKTSTLWTPRLSSLEKILTTRPSGAISVQKTVWDSTRTSTTSSMLQLRWSSMELRKLLMSSKRETPLQDSLTQRKATGMPASFRRLGQRLYCRIQPLQVRVNFIFEMHIVSYIITNF